MSAAGGWPREGTATGSAAGLGTAAAEGSTSSEAATAPADGGASSGAGFAPARGIGPTSRVASRATTSAERSRERDQRRATCMLSQPNTRSAGLPGASQRVPLYQTDGRRRTLHTSSVLLVALARRVAAQALDGVVDERVVDHGRRVDVALHVAVVGPPLHVVGEGAHVDVAVGVQADRRQLLEHGLVLHRGVAAEDVDDLGLAHAAGEGVPVIAQPLHVGEHEPLADRPLLLDEMG